MTADQIMRGLAGHCPSCGGAWLMAVVTRDAHEAEDGFIVCVNPECEDVQAAQRSIT